MRRRKGRGRILSDHELAMFSMQMAMLLKSGISPYEGVNILFEDTQSGEGKKLLLRMKEVLSRGERLHTAAKCFRIITVTWWRWEKKPAVWIRFWMS